VRQRHEENGVIRWLDEDEEERLRQVIRDDYPEHLPALEIADYGGRRTTRAEQF